MNFSRPATYQIYILAGCAIVFVVSVFLVKTKLSQTIEISNIATTTIVTGIKTSTSAQPLIPPAASTTAVVKKPTTPASPLDSITAEAYLVGNLATGQVYLSKNTTMVNGLASISKLFTAIIAQENMDASQTIQITPAMLAVYPNSYGVELGEKFALSDLIYGMLLQSNDNIAEGIAMAYSSPSTYVSAPAGAAPSEDSFIAKMNALAASIGLAHTRFQDASGLSAGNVTNANDLFSFAQYLCKNQQSLLGITDTYSYPVATTTDHFGHDFINIDPFVGDPAYIGGKTGRTDEAGEDMLSIFNYKAVNGTTYPIVVIVLHSALSERQNDVSILYLQAIDAINKLAQQNQNGN